MSETREPSLEEVVQIGKEQMSLEDQARSESRENRFNALSAEQQNMLDKSNLKIETSKEKNGGEEQETDLITGDVKIDGTSYRIELYRMRPLGGQKGNTFRGIIGDSRLDDPVTTEQLFKFYHP